jgi:hypothetical protein
MSKQFGLGEALESHIYSKQTGENCFQAIGKTWRIALHAVDQENAHLE